MKKRNTLLEYGTGKLSITSIRSTNSALQEAASFSDGSHTENLKFAFCISFAKRWKIKGNAEDEINRETKHVSQKFTL